MAEIAGLSFMLFVLAYLGITNGPIAGETLHLLIDVCLIVNS